MAAILAHLKLGCGGNKCALSNGIFVEFCTFPDLIQEAAAVDEKNLSVSSKKATLGIRLEQIEEMYVLILNFAKC